MSVSLSVCRTITFKCLDVGRSYLHIRYISKQYGSCSYMEVIGWSSQQPKTSKLSIPAVYISMAYNSGSIKDRATRFACVMGFSTTADRMMWPPSFVTWSEVTTRNLYLSVIYLYVCQTITFESLDVISSYLHIGCISRRYGSSSYTKVIGSKSRSWKQKVPKFLLPQLKFRSPITQVL